MICPPKTLPGINREAQRKRSFEMKKSKYTEERIIGVVKRMEAGEKVKDLTRETGARSLLK